ncbi:MAG: hypothetical protein JWR85_3569 [Marmoricola sp.]|nr:hypothetical protein [Marmoricola sp.]
MTLLDTVLAAAIPARRYPITQLADGVTGYGPWRIYFDPPPIPVRNCDWQYHHDDFDGAEDSNDNRAGSCASFADALNECDAVEDDV